ncbi:permease prefix domain 1-containing protein [Demequina iriomotensis]|uniref:permease prefix domain 1-containing protein n=1 Tax=Demequina iriomotensis TaxID=1536641 RepID=UPI000780CC3A|nr:permease prefix domain 1-containing protein [Demequina iriomotensis]
MNTDIHRLLDEAFADVEMTSEARDLKEEIRANLMARTGELEGDGLSPVAAARRAIEELGPLDELLGETAPSSAASGRPEPVAVLHARHKVRPKPGFVVRATLLPVVAAAAATVATLVAVNVIDGRPGAILGLGLLAAAALGWVTADALAQETTTNHPMPVGRAAAWGAATFAALGAVAAGGTFAADTDTVGFAALGGTLALAATGMFAWLGATQTNRHKAWVRGPATDPAHHLDRFATDEAAATRFGLSMAALWVVGLALAVALAVAVAWWWALIVLAACVAAMMLMLATMLVGSHSTR